MHTGVKFDQKFMNSILGMHGKMTQRKIAERLEELYGVRVDHTTISRWIKKYAPRSNPQLDVDIYEMLMDHIRISYA